MERHNVADRIKEDEDIVNDNISELNTDFGDFIDIDPNEHKEFPMVELVKIPISQLKPFIELGFADDQEMMDKYRTHTGDFEEQMRFNYDTICEDAKTYQMQCYKVVSNGDDIGFTVLIKTKTLRMLYSFAINVKYRKKGVLLDWISAIDKELGRYWVIGLYMKNGRAIEFFKKNGFTKTQLIPQNKSILMARPPIKLRHN